MNFMTLLSCPYSIKSEKVDKIKIYIYIYISNRMDANRRNELSGLQSNKDQAIYVYDKRSEIKDGANHQAEHFPLG